MKRVETIPEFLATLPLAIARMEQLIKDYPGDSFLESILRQLKHVAEWTAEGRTPAKEQIEKLSFGTMASKAVADTDDECARMLYSLSYFLRHWPTAR
ncbi:MAG: immunity protein Tsi6 family protein [Nibricoccus sp.]